MRTWVGRGHGQMDYFLTQALTGHGCFGTYLTRIKKVPDSSCRYCGETDTPKHTLFHCRKWVNHREDAKRAVGEIVTRGRMTEIMIESEEGWEAVRIMITSILSAKEREEREQRKEEGRRRSQH